MIGKSAKKQCYCFDGFVIQIELICTLAKYRPNYNVAVAAAVISSLSVAEVSISSTHSTPISVYSEFQKRNKSNDHQVESFSRQIKVIIVKKKLFLCCTCLNFSKSFAHAHTYAFIFNFFSWFLFLFLHFFSPFLSYLKVPAAQQSLKCTNYMELSNWACQVYTWSSASTLCTHVNSNHSIASIT